MDNIFKASEIVISNIFRTKGLKEIITRNRGSKSLIDALSVYPNRGVNFYAYDKNWENGEVGVRAPSSNGSTSRSSGTRRAWSRRGGKSGA